MYKLKVTLLDGTEEVEFSEITNINFYDLSKVLEKHKVKEVVITKED